MRAVFINGAIINGICANDACVRVEGSLVDCVADFCSGHEMTGIVVVRLMRGMVTLILDSLLVQRARLALVLLLLTSSRGSVVAFIS